VPITVLYVVLGLSIAALLGVAAAIFLRIRRLSTASKTQFTRAVEEQIPQQSAAIIEPGSEPMVKSRG
jgi:ABC-type nitrate/sulfonate/bicarbonate transport system permease component